MEQLTTPTKITQEQYEKAYFAINRENGDHWLINNIDGICLYVGTDMESLKNTTTDMMSGELQGAEVSGEFVVDGHGTEIEVECITFPTAHAYNNLDLEKLSEGIIDWK